MYSYVDSCSLPVSANTNLSDSSGCVSSVEIVGGTEAPLVFELRGTDGTLTIRGAHPGGYQCGDLTVAVSADAPPQPATRLPGLAGAAINVGELHHRFAQDIRESRHTVPDFARAVALTRLLDAIDEASAKGCTVKLPARSG